MRASFAHDAGRWAPSALALAFVALATGGAAPAPVREPKAAAARPERTTKKDRRAVIEAFPRTRQLLQYLEEKDPELHARLIESVAGTAAEREQEALEFARELHPELHGVLLPLRERNPKAYAAAVRELFVEHRRQARLKTRDPQAYAAAREAWSLRSQARLKAARAVLGKDPKPASDAELLALLVRAEQQQKAEIAAQIASVERKLQKLRQRLAEDPAEAAAEKLAKIKRKAEKRIRNKEKNR